MNILLISRNSPFESIGGIERYIDNLIVYYKDSLDKKSKLNLMLPTNGINHVDSKGNVNIYFNNSLYLPRNSQATKKEITKKSHLFSKDLLQIIKEGKIDIICVENFHSDLPPAYSLLLNMVTMSLKIPLVLHIHSFASTELQTELINQLKWDKISCVSKSVAGDCFQKGSDIDSLSIHYLGVNTEEFNKDIARNTQLKSLLSLPSDSKIILTATRIIRGKKNILEEKGIINLIEAFSKLSPRYPNLKLVIAIGKPPENLKKEFDIAYEMLQGYVKLHNVEGKTILKMFNLHEMPDVYRGSDIFVLASENETFGQVFLEAMSCGIPVIGTKIGGIPEIISDSYNGYLIPPADSSILAQKITYLINNNQTREKFIETGIKTVKEKFAAKHQIDEFNKMLLEVFESSKNQKINIPKL